MHRRAVLILTIGFLVIPAWAQTHKPAHKAAAMVGRIERIPREGYETWSLFPICNPKWLTPQSESALRSLYTDFQAFGRTIGDDNVAVWLWKAKRRKQDDLGDDIDIERSVRFCRAFNLVPSDGPFVVVTSTYPDEEHLPTGLPTGSAVIKFGNMPPQQAESLLFSLTDRLLMTNKPPTVATARKAQSNPPTDISSPPETAALSRLLDAVRQTIDDFGCAWSVKFNVGPASTELHSCRRGRTDGDS